MLGRSYKADSQWVAENLGDLKEKKQSERGSCVKENEKDNLRQKQVYLEQDEGSDKHC